jgi:predicted DNA-binding protein
MKKSIQPREVLATHSIEKEPTVRFTVDLPKSLHRKFSVLAVQQERDKAVIVREWLEDLLKDVEV